MAMVALQVGAHLSAIRLAYEHMSGFVQAVGTGGRGLGCQHKPQLVGVCSIMANIL